MFPVFLEDDIRSWSHGKDAPVSWGSTKTLIVREVVELLSQCTSLSFFIFVELRLDQIIEHVI